MFITQIYLQEEELENLLQRDESLYDALHGSSSRSDFLRYANNLRVI